MYSQIDKDRRKIYTNQPVSQHLSSTCPKLGFVLEAGVERREAGYTPGLCPDWASRFWWLPSSQSPSPLNSNSSLVQRLTILCSFTLCVPLHQINISGLMFKLDTYICTGFIHVNRDSICDVTTVQEYNRQVAFSSGPHGNKLTGALDSGTHQ